MKDAQGPLNRGIDYENTVMQHYRALWNMGVPVDVIGSEDDFSRYKLIVAPMMYLCTEQVAPPWRRLSPGRHACRHVLVGDRQ